MCDKEGLQQLSKAVLQPWQVWGTNLAVIGVYTIYMRMHFQS